MAESNQKSKELISTLSQLESAIRAWENASRETSEAEIAKEGSDEAPLTQAPQLAQSLLKRLREQIDELSD